MKSLKVGVLALSTVLLLGACGTSKVKPEDTRKVLTPIIIIYTEKK